MYCMNNCDISRYTDIYIYIVNVCVIVCFRFISNELYHNIYIYFFVFICLLYMDLHEKVQLYCEQSST